MNEREAVQRVKSGSNLRAVGMVLVVGVVYVGFAIAIVKVQRAASSPDFGKGIRMRMYQDVQKVAYRQASWWGQLGLKAESMYGKSRGI
jgi:hypothetical protein